MKKHIKNMLKRINNIIDTNAEDITYGICRSVGHLKEERDLIIEIFKKWDKYSGDKTYPIPHPALNPKCAYDTETDKWDKNTEYGKSRWRALYYLKEELKKYKITEK